ncbi:hypothetical protein [Embleya sp. AB8]|uniref:hypothetical protein n=1 Tax=Embleya sp. AB8 TaxID=3156304 RepID=UPI003C749D93
MSHRPTPTGPTITSPTVHRFDSTGDAYDATQCRDDIADGDVLVVAREGVVGFLNRAWPAALTTEHGEFHTLGVFAHEVEDGQYAASVRVAREQAEALGIPLDTRYRPKPGPKPRPAVVGDRILCSDGTAHTVCSVDTITSHSGVTRRWLFVEGGSAWPADTCKLIDTTRVAQACEDARRATASIHWGIDGQYDLGDALCYLGQAAPDVLAKMADEATGRIRLEIPRLDIAPTDILYAHGARLNVLAVGFATLGDGAQQWWATVHGVTEDDRRATYPVPWDTGMAVDYAAGDWVEVERILPGLPA